MTKQELYAALKDAGADVPDYRHTTREQMEALYAEWQARQAGQAADAVQMPAPVTQAQPEGNPPMMFFTHSGWCEELQCSYFMGYYRPASWREYNALKPFAQGVPND